jgi:hypothetical protein
MARSVIGIMPDELIRADKHQEAIDWLARQPLAGGIKAELLLGWSFETGVRVTGSELDAVKGTGINIRGRG